MDRQTMEKGLFGRIVEQLGAADDVALMLGGVGDALCCEDWPAYVAAAKSGGVWGVGVTTDLLVDRDALDVLLGAGLDVVVVRINADDRERYTRLMGVDAFDQVMKNVEYLLSHRHDGLPWVVPSLVKTVDNVDQLESFVDRWTYYAGHALVVGPSTGRGAMPDQGVMAMPLPARYVRHRDTTAMHVLSDGKVVASDDWLASAAWGDLSRERLVEVWDRQVASAMSVVG